MPEFAEITELAARLRLTYIRDNAEEVLKKARRNKLETQDILTELLTGEVERRAEHTVKERLASAKFPVRKYLADFDRTKYKPEFLPKFRELESLSFIDNKENVILVGSSGAGKTHYAMALGVAACMAGKSVLFATVPNLVIEMREMMTEHQFTQYRRKFERYNLVILDELGYISYDKSGAEMLFSLLSNRHEKGSVIVTTNLPFDRWESVLSDPILTAALVDRLAHKAHILDISRDDGGRFEETLAWLKNMDESDLAATAP
jgi:DNA replication protein DnaC